MPTAISACAIAVLLVLGPAGCGAARYTPELQDAGDGGVGPSADGPAVTGGAVECTLGQSRICYLGPPETQGVGPCRAGSQSCGPVGRWLAFCADQVTPRLERCDGVDDDCNGKIDDDDNCNKPNGAVCNTPDQCQSNRCTDGRCCAGVCGPCQTCTGAGGTCELPPGVRACGSICRPISECCESCALCTSCNAATGRCDPATGPSCAEGLIRGTCRAGRCVPVCMPGTTKCTGNRLDTCLADGSGYLAGPVCSGNHRCEVDACTANCADGFRNCDGNCYEVTGPASEPCAAAGAAVCTRFGATCEVHTKNCKRYMCRWNVARAACGQGDNRGIVSEACSVFSQNNPGAVPLGAAFACLSVVANLDPTMPDCVE
jgi:hypothetical protein